LVSWGSKIRKLQLLYFSPKKEKSQEISQINNAKKEKLLPLKIELKEKLVMEEKKEKQVEIYNFREFPFCFFSSKELHNLLNF